MSALSHSNSVANSNEMPRARRFFSLLPESKLISTIYCIYVYTVTQPLFFAQRTGTFGHEVSSATDCFLVPERGNSPLPRQQTLEDPDSHHWPRALGLFRDGKARAWRAVLSPSLKRLPRSQHRRPVFPRPLESAFNGTINLPPSSVNS